MRSLVAILALVMPLSAHAFSFATGGCATAGCAAGEQWEYTNANEIDTALDSLETTSASHTSSISTLTGTFASYLPLAGGTMTGSITMSSGQAVIIPTGAAVVATGSGAIYATGMLGSGTTTNATDLATAEVSGTLPVANGGTGATSLTNLLTLATHTVGNFVATIADSGASEITVTGSGSENAAVTLAIASTLARDSEVTSAVAAVSAASSTNTAVPRFSGTSGDLQDSGVLIDGSNNVTGIASLTTNTLTVGSSGVGCGMYRDTDDAGWTECCFLNGTQTCGIDADGTIDGTP